MDADSNLILPKPAQKVPLPMLVISLGLFASSLLSLLSHVSLFVSGTYSQIINSSSDHSWPIALIATQILTSVFFLVSAVGLLRLKKWSLYVFIAALLLSLGGGIYFKDQGTILVTVSVALVSHFLYLIALVYVLMKRKLFSIARADLEPSKQTAMRFLKAVGTAVPLYAVIGLTAITLNPLAAYIFLGPYFEIQSIVAEFGKADINRKLAKVEESSLPMPSELTESDCIGFLGTEGFMKNDYPGIIEYAQKLNVGAYDTVGVCKTPKGTFVVKSSYGNGIESQLNQVFLDDGGELKKLFEFGDTVAEFAEDSDRNVFLLSYKDINGNTSRQPFAYDPGSKSFLKVVQIPDVFKVCSRSNKEQCMTWRVRNFPLPTKAGYDPAEQQREYEALLSAGKGKTAAQLECIADFVKESSRSSGDVKNIKLLSDLNEDPVFTCLTDISKRPFDFDIYVLGMMRVDGQLTQFLPNWAFFDAHKERVIDYQMSYPGFTIFNYAQDSVSYQIFKKLTSGKYKVGELIPDIDNNEAGYAGFRPSNTLASLDKTTYKNVEIYTIKSSTRYKAFVHGGTYILIRYDSRLNSAISEDLATKIAQSMVDAKPFVPQKAGVSQNSNAAQGSPEPLSNTSSAPAAGQHDNKLSYLVPGSKPAAYIELSAKADPSVSQSEIQMIQSEIKNGVVSYAQDCVNRITSLYNGGGQSSKDYALLVADACVYYLYRK